MCSTVKTTKEFFLQVAREKDPCTLEGKQISENLIRVAATRIFSNPAQSILELPVNSIDSYNSGSGRPSVGKFGMGFFSILYWLFLDTTRTLRVESVYELDGKNVGYTLILSYETYLKVTVINSAPTRKGVRGTTITLDKLSANEILDFQSQLHKLIDVEKVDIYYKSPTIDMFGIVKHEVIKTQINKGKYPTRPIIVHVYDTKKNSVAQLGGGALTKEEELELERMEEAILLNEQKHDKQFHLKLEKLINDRKKLLEDKLANAKTPEEKTKAQYALDVLTGKIQQQIKVRVVHEENKISQKVEKNLSITISDNAKGLPLQVALESLLVPSSSTKTIATASSAAVIEPEKTRTSFRNTLVGEVAHSYFNITVNDICVVQTKTLRKYIVGEQGKDQHFIMSLPSNSRLPVSRDDVVLDDKNTLESFYNELVELFSSVAQRTGDINELRELIGLYEKQSTQERVRYYVEDAYKTFVNENSEFIFVVRSPIMEYLAQKYKSSKFVFTHVMDHRDVESKLLAIMKEGKDYFSNEFPLRNVVFVPMDDVMTTEGFSSLFFLSQKLKEKSSWKDEVVMATNNTRILAKDWNSDEDRQANIDKLKKLRRTEDFQSLKKDVEEYMRLCRKPYNQLYPIIERDFWSPYCKAAIKSKEFLRYLPLIQKVILTFDTKTKNYHATEFCTVSVSELVYMNAFIIFLIDPDSVEYAMTLWNSTIAQLEVKQVYGEAKDLYVYRPDGRDLPLFDFDQFSSIPSYIKDLDIQLILEYFRSSAVIGTIPFMMLNPVSQYMFTTVARGMDKHNYWQKELKKFTGYQFLEPILKSDKLDVKEKYMFSYWCDEFWSHYVYQVIVSDWKEDVYKNFIESMIYDYKSRVSTLETDEAFLFLVTSSSGKSMETHRRIINQMNFYGRTLISILDKSDSLPIPISDSPNPYKYTFSAKQIIKYVYANGFPNKDLETILTDVCNTQDYENLRLQIIDIVINDGTTKDFEKSVITELYQNSLDAARETADAAKNIDIIATDQYLEVKDYVGIPDKSLLAIMIPFFSTKSSANVSTTGEMGTGFFNVFRQPWSRSVKLVSYVNNKRIEWLATPVVNSNKRVTDISYQMNVEPAVGRGRGTLITVNYNQASREQNITSKINALLFTKTCIVPAIGFKVTLNAEKLERPQIVVFWSDKIKVTVFTDKLLLRSTLATNGAPLSFLKDLVFDNVVNSRPGYPLLDARLSYEITSDMQLDILKGFYKPVQSRDKIILEKSRSLEKDLLQGMTNAVIYKQTANDDCYEKLKKSGDFEVMLHFASRAEFTQLLDMGKERDFTNSKFTIDDLYNPLICFSRYSDVASTLAQLLYSKKDTDVGGAPLEVRFNELTKPHLWAQKRELLKTFIRTHLIKRIPQLGENFENSYPGRYIVYWFTNKPMSSRSNAKTPSKMMSMKKIDHPAGAYLTTYVQSLWAIGKAITHKKFFPGACPKVIFQENMECTLLGYYSKGEHAIKFNTRNFNSKQIENVLEEGLRKARRAASEKGTAFVTSIDGDMPQFFSLALPLSVLYHELEHAWRGEVHGNGSEGFHGSLILNFDIPKRYDFDDAAIVMMQEIVKNGFVDHYLKAMTK